MAEKREAKYDIKMIVLVAAVFLLLGAGAMYFNQGKPAVPPAQPAGTDVSSPSAKLLLGAFDRGASLKDYSLAYTTNDNGQKNNYTIKKNGNQSWVKVEGTFGQMVGFFGANASEDIACLNYSNENVCAKIMNRSGATEIAASLKILLPDRKTYESQKDQMIKLITARAIVVDAATPDETIGTFETSRVSYTLNYRGLTVTQLQSIGISPNDPVLTSVTNQKVVFWIDKKTGFAVKSSADYVEQGVKKAYDMTYSVAEFAAPTMPAEPEKIDATGALIAFYNRAQADFSKRAACNAMLAPEQDFCFKNAAVESKRWDLCQQIKNQTTYEGCSLIVAQSTNNYGICANLTLLADDCYISVAGETGNFDLCKKLKNSSLGESCTLAANAGKAKIEARDEAYRRMVSLQNCNVSADCQVKGNSRQYCVPKNSTSILQDGSAPTLKCYQYASCGCDSGFCAFDRNETYYQCVNDVETDQLKNFLKQIAAEAKINSTATKNSSNTSANGDR